MKVSVFSATKIAALFSLFTLAACGDLFTAPTITAPNNEVLESSAEVAFSGELELTRFSGHFA